MKILTRITLIAPAALLLSAQVLHASPCQALAAFFSDVVEASGAEVEPKQFKAQVTRIQQVGKACSAIATRMADQRAYTHAIAGSVLPLNAYLRDDARFAVQVIGEGEKIEIIKFDAGAVAVLRRRPTR